jgi:hypothetical protein
MRGVMPDEVLAVCRLRQWVADRAAMRAGQVTKYQREGWRERRTRDSNARIVPVIDFERALSRLSEERQAVLLLTSASTKTTAPSVRLPASVSVR